MAHGDIPGMTLTTLAKPAKAKKLPKMAMAGVDGPKPTRVAEGLDAEYMLRKLDELDAQVARGMIKGRDTSGTTAALERHLAKMRELGIAVPKGY